MSIPLRSTSTSRGDFFVSAVERLRSAITMAEESPTIEERLETAIERTASLIARNERLIQAELFVIDDGLNRRKGTS